MVSNSNLVLIFSLIEVFIEHLNEGLLGIKLTLVILWVDVDLVFQFLGFGDTHDFTPVSKEFLFVEVDNLVLAFDFRSKNVFFHFGEFFELIELVLRFGDLSDFDVLFRRKAARSGASAFESLAQKSHSIVIFFNLLKKETSLLN